MDSGFFDLITRNEDSMKHLDLINKMTLEEKEALMSGKVFWETSNINRDFRDLVSHFFVIEKCMCL